MDQFDRKWITANALEEIDNYEKGILTLRGLHYRLVARGMTNTIQHYKRVVGAMIKARREGLVDYDVFVDHDRGMETYTRYEDKDFDQQVNKAKYQLEAWMRNYSRNRWENQPIYPEVWIEKKALIGTFNSVCSDNRVALAACKGYPSLTFLHDAYKRFSEVEETTDAIPTILYFGDYDPSGEDIPRSIKENLLEMGVRVNVERILLLEDQVLEWGLPPAPAKRSDSRTAKWDGLGQVELDAVEPSQMQEIIQDAIDDHFDEGIYDEVVERQDEEREEYRSILRKYVDEEL